MNEKHTRTRILTCFSNMLLGGTVTCPHHRFICVATFNIPAGYGARVAIKGFGGPIVIAIQAYRLPRHYARAGNESATL